MNSTESVGSPAALNAPGRYRTLAAKFTDRVEAVPADAWDNQSPCSEWTVRDVVRHVVDTQHYIVTVVGLALPDATSPDTDPVAAWRETRDAMQAVLDDPEHAAREYDGHFGRTTLGDTIANFYCFDLVVHGWDVAHGAGIDDTIDDADLEWIDSLRGVMGDNIRMDGVCGPEISTREGADLQTRVLAYLGRTA
ncbi:TIGR03086 family metal-binding protein [Rhodococcus sp. HNM0569]|uniref:TIGR03086 family metal-binding protein n=1 Tax=Rhodococcus sp. HNM0569 TaxID=2716340 RepID=UPI00146E032F|nr:TIGR03086 family metal-binding protein [Rhodococcus sp. HNM0569]NLU83494.1 TIGR03086 family protein [Rhodococcus sp. HNM0569]